jgi:hypothetical protein
VCTETGGELPTGRLNTVKHQTDRGKVLELCPGNEDGYMGPRTWGAGVGVCEADAGALVSGMEVWSSRRLC